MDAGRPIWLCNGRHPGKILKILLSFCILPETQMKVGDQESIYPAQGKPQ